MSINIIAVGANGRMGKNLIQAVWNDPECVLAGAIDSVHCPALGKDAGVCAVGNHMGVVLGSDLNGLLTKTTGVVIDFSSPDSTAQNAGICRTHKVPLVVGTTGLNSEQELFLHESARHIPIVKAPNMSTGVNVLFSILSRVAGALNDGYDIEIFEAHHRNKVDAPSGTAKHIAQILCDHTGRKYPQDIIYERHTRHEARQKREIGLQVMRGGDLVGEHSVFFCGQGERLELRHVATNRQTFATGAVRAAKWVVEQKPGLYSMQDVLGFQTGR